ncbi:MAG: hypothetical protein ACI9M9_001971 [Flavobacteriaceae bacterium]|jgi:hypothetical protein
MSGEKLNIESHNLNHALKQKSNGLEVLQSNNPTIQNEVFLSKSKSSTLKLFAALTNTVEPIVSNKLLVLVTKAYDTHY